MNRHIDIDGFDAYHGVPTEYDEATPERREEIDQAIAEEEQERYASKSMVLEVQGMHPIRQRYF